VILATICARAGSVGLPNKNLLELDGRSLIQIAVDKAEECKLIDRIIVSTDIEARFLPRSANFYNVGRPTNLRGGAIPKWMVLQEMLRNYKDVEIEAVVDIDVTRPLTTPDDILHTATTWLDHADHDHTFAVCRADKTPYQDILESDHDGFLTLSKGPEVTARQDAPPCWYHGGIWVYGTDALGVDHSPYDGKIGYHEIDPERCLDIDNAADWELVQTEYGKCPETSPAE